MSVLMFGSAGGQTVLWEEYLSVHTNRVGKKRKEEQKIKQINLVNPDLSCPGGSIDHQ
jgi:hypothetical protein